MTTKINPDLARERQKCTFNTSELTHLLDGNAEETRKRRKLESFFLDDPELTDGIPLEYLSHKEKYEENIRKISICARKIGSKQISLLTEFLGSLLGNAIFKDADPLAVHFGMFIPTIKSQGTEEQKEKWLQRAMNCNILGTYAQTELGHGTFIRGLETTATYDAKTQEFVLNSPTITSYKWWPGALGNTANYCVVLAQLYTQGKCYGIHPFIVQLRDEETHIPLPGIDIGDIGARLGMSGANNGYLGFKNVRISKDNLLMRNSKVLEDGTYIPSTNSKLTYGIMVRIRVTIVEWAAESIKKCTTIAVRYSCVRRQSQQKPGEPECQIIDYVTQQYKLFPQIATYFAFRYSALWIKDMLNQITSELEKGDLNRLPDLHAFASCLKAVTSTDATSAIETCRLSCGGHGYMMCSSFPIAYGMATPMCTYEGENTVLLLQTARFLMKTWTKVVEGQSLTPLVNYLKMTRSNKEMLFKKSIDWIVCVLEEISRRKIELAWKHMAARIEKGTSPEDAWNLTSIELVAAAEMFARTFIVKTYSVMMSTITNTVSLELKTVLVQLLELYGVYTILNKSGDLLRFTGAEGSTIDDLQVWLEELLELIRPNAVGIVDSFDLHDEILSSALGAYDGNVYERLFEEASKSPLNNEAVNKTFELYLKPFMKSKY